MTDRNYNIIRAHERIVKKCNLDSLEASIALAISEAIKGLFFDAKFAEEKLKMPIELVREGFENLNLHIIEHAIFKMKKAVSTGTVINSTKNYLMVCLYNSISEYVSDRLADPNIKQDILKQ